MIASDNSLFIFRSNGSVDLLATGASWSDVPYQFNKNKENPFHYLFSSHDSEYRSADLSEKILLNSDNYKLLASQDNQGISPLHKALHYRDWKMLSLIDLDKFSKIGDLNKPDFNGHTPLHFAAHAAIDAKIGGVDNEGNFYLKIVKKMIECGARYDFPYNKDGTIADNLAQYGLLNILKSVAPPSPPPLPPLSSFPIASPVALHASEAETSRAPVPVIGESFRVGDSYDSEGIEMAHNLQRQRDAQILAQRAAEQQRRVE